MAKINFNWLLANMTGKACSHDEVYTKTNRQTGRSYAVKLCNPVSGNNPTVKQQKQRTKFGAIIKAVSAWVLEERAKENGMGSVAYNKAMAAYKSQHTIGSLRGFITKKYVSYNESTGAVTINVEGSTTTVVPTNPNQGTENQGTENQGTENQNPGSNTSGGGIDYGGQGYM